MVLKIEVRTIRGGWSTRYDGPLAMRIRYSFLKMVGRKGRGITGESRPFFTLSEFVTKNVT